MTFLGYAKFPVKKLNAKVTRAVRNLSHVHTVAHAFLTDTLHIWPNSNKARSMGHAQCLSKSSKVRSHGLLEVLWVIARSCHRHYLLRFSGARCYDSIYKSYIYIIYIFYKMLSRNIPVSCLVTSGMFRRDHYIRKQYINYVNGLTRCRVISYRWNPCLISKQHDAIAILTKSIITHQNIYV